MNSASGNETLPIIPFGIFEYAFRAIVGKPFSSRLCTCLLQNEVVYRTISKRPQIFDGVEHTMIINKIIHFYWGCQNTLTFVNIDEIAGHI